MKTKILVIILQIIIFISLFPILMMFTYTGGLYNSNYIPIIFRISEFFINSKMWEYSLILCPLSFFILLYVIILLKKTYIKTQIIFNIPFIPALLIQYFIATKIDQYYYMSKDLNKNISEFYSYIFNSEFIFYHIKIGIIYILLISLFFYIFKGINLIINKYKKTKLKEDNYESV